MAKLVGDDARASPSMKGESPSSASINAGDVSVLKTSQGVDANGEKGSAASKADRGLWGSQLEFVMTCISYAVGIGNIWRFPYLCYKNGGGAFLVPYGIMLCVAGIPIFFMEMALGQFSSLGPTAVWRCCPLMKGIGYGMVVVSAYVCIYFAVLIAYVLFYLIHSFSTKLPFSHCDNAWNTENCTVRDGSANVAPANLSFFNETLRFNATSSNASFAAAIAQSTSSEEFFYRHVLRMSGGIEEFGLPDWRLSLLLLLTWAMTLVGLIRGVQSLGKVSYFTASFPYLIITILVVRGCTLDGAAEGVLFYVTPRWEKLLEPSVWADAATQIFYSLGVCMGSLIAMSSYNRFDNDCLKNAVTVAVVNCGTSFFAGFAIFSVIGFMSKKARLNVEDTLEAGPGLTFVVYPEGLSKMPLAPLWSILFYLMMTTIGMGSNLSQLETVISALQDEWPVLRRRGLLFRTAACVVGFLAGLPLVSPGGFYLFHILDNYAAGINLLLLGLMEVVTVVYIYGFDRFSEDVSMMLGKTLSGYWRICLRFLSVFAVSAILVVTCARYEPLKFGDYSYPHWAVSLGWLVSLSSLIWLPLLFMKNYCIRSGMWEEVLALSRAEDTWGPSIDENRTGRYDDDDDDDDNDGDDREADGGEGGDDDVVGRRDEIDSSGDDVPLRRTDLPLRFVSVNQPPRYSMSMIPTSTRPALPVFTQAGALKESSREDSAVSSLNYLSSVRSESTGK